MRIIVCSKMDLAGALVLNRLIPALADHEVQVFLSDKIRAAETTVPELVELKHLERDLPVHTVFPLIDRIGDDGAALATFQGLSRRYGIPLESVKAINTPEMADRLRAWAPDIILSIRFSLIFKPEIYEIPRIGTYNIHPGALPRYAGLFAAFRAMINGDAIMGTTLHRVEQVIDAGPIIGIGWVDVDPKRDLLSHVLAAYNPGIDLFMECLAAWSAGNSVSETPQDTTPREYRGMPSNGDFHLFHSKGFRLYDPTVYNHLLGQFMPQQVTERLG